MRKVSGIYKITNSVTTDFYIGSSIDVKKDGRTIKVHQCGKISK